MRKFILSFGVVLFLFLSACTHESVEPMQELTITESVAKTDSDSKTEIRFGGKKPLIIVMRNGEKLDMPLDDIDPNNIASIDVFKDPKTLKAYGEKGKDGVIIVHLKD